MLFDIRQNVLMEWVIFIKQNRETYKLVFASDNGKFWQLSLPHKQLITI